MSRKPQYLQAKYNFEYQKNYSDLPWYDRDFVTYYKWLDYKDMADNPDHYMNKVKVVNFDIIYHKCREDPLQKFYKEHKTLEKNDLKNYPENDKKDVLSAACRSGREDLWIKRGLIFQSFK